MASILSSPTVYSCPFSSVAVSFWRPSNVGSCNHLVHSIKVATVVIQDSPDRKMQPGVTTVFPPDLLINTLYSAISFGQCESGIGLGDLMSICLNTARLISIVPSNQATSIGTSATIQIPFSKMMNSLSITNSTLIVSANLVPTADFRGQ
jgi:hypothetical protein